MYLFSHMVLIAVLVLIDKMKEKDNKYFVELVANDSQLMAVLVVIFRLLV